MTGLWKEKGVPHKGWSCISDYDARPDDMNFDSDPTEDYPLCQMCQVKHIRYVFVMRHPDYPRQLEVGCDCAEHMSGDYVNPRIRESRLRNRALRRARWLKRKWRKSAKGNDYINAEGFNLVVYPDKRFPGRWSWRIVNDDRDIKAFSRRTFADIESAKLNLFDEFMIILDRLENLG